MKYPFYFYGSSDSIDSDVLISIPKSDMPDNQEDRKKLVKILDKANRILLSLSAFLPSIINILEKSIEILEDYKRQLLNINGILEVASVNSDSGKNLLSGNQFGTDFEQYKGFKFAIREDNDPKFIIRGNKRHYAVAIDTNNVEVLKSEKSYTLDPEDLISTLKLIIDKENLIA